MLADLLFDPSTGFASLSGSSENLSVPNAAVYGEGRSSRRDAFEMSSSSMASKSLIPKTDSVLSLQGTLEKPELPEFRGDEWGSSKFHLGDSAISSVGALRNRW